MSAGDIQLGVSGSESLLPATGRTFSESIEEVSREERTASGRLVRDIRATKKVFTLSYELIDGDDLEDFKTLYDLQTELNLIHEYTASQTEQYTVLMRPFDYTRLVLLSPGLWQGATIELAEV